MKKFIASSIITVMVLPFCVYLLGVYTDTFAKSSRVDNIEKNQAVKNTEFSTKLEAMHSDIIIIKEALIKAP